LNNEGLILYCCVVTTLYPQHAVAACLFRASITLVRVQVCGEVDRFTGDVHHLDGLDFQQELNSDYVLAARLALSK
jgi:hypothetical protein